MTATKSKFVIPSGYMNQYTGIWTEFEKPWVRDYPSTMRLDNFRMEGSRKVNMDHLAEASGAFDRYQKDPSKFTWVLEHKNDWGEIIKDHWQENLVGVSFDDLDVVYLDYLTGNNRHGKPRSKTLKPMVLDYRRTVGRHRWDDPIAYVDRKKVVSEITGKAVKEEKPVGWMYTNLNTYMAYTERRDSGSLNSEMPVFDEEDTWYTGANFLYANERMYRDLDPSPWTTVYGMVNSVGELRNAGNNLYTLPSREGTIYEWSPGNDMILNLVNECMTQRKKWKDSNNTERKPTLSFETVKSKRNNPEEVWHIEIPLKPKLLGKDTSGSATIFYYHESKKINAMKMTDSKIVRGSKDNKSPFQVICEETLLDPKDPLAGCVNWRDEKYYYRRTTYKNNDWIVLYEYDVTGKELFRLAGKWIRNVIRVNKLKNVGGKYKQVYCGNELEYAEGCRIEDVEWNIKEITTEVTKSSKKIYKRVYLPEITEEWNYVGKAICKDFLTDNTDKHLVMKLVEVSKTRTTKKATKRVEKNKEVFPLKNDFIDNHMWIPTLNAITTLRTMYQALVERGLEPMEVRGIERMKGSQESKRRYSYKVAKESETECEITTVHTVGEKKVTNLPDEGYLTKEDIAKRLVTTVKGIVGSIPGIAEYDSPLNIAVKEIHRLKDFFFKKIEELLKEIDPWKEAIEDMHSLKKDGKICKDLPRAFGPEDFIQLPLEDIELSKNYLEFESQFEEFKPKKASKLQTFIFQYKGGTVCIPANNRQEAVRLLLEETNDLIEGEVPLMEERTKIFGKVVI